MLWLTSRSGPKNIGGDDEARHIRDAQRGDANAFEALMTSYEKTIYGIALRMCDNPEDAQDMTQEAMLRIFRSIGSFKGDAKFSTWVYRITTNVCLDEFRRKKRRKEQSLEVLSESGQQFTDTPQNDPEFRQERSEMASRLKKALLLLPSDLRMAVLLRDVQGFSYEEIGQITGAALGTVKSRISRGRGRLREIIRKEPGINAG